MEAGDAHDLSGGADRNGIRRPELKCAMRASMVVAVEELRKAAREMALAGNNQKIEAFPTCGFDQALDERIRTRAPIGSKRYFGAFSCEDGVELRGELGW